MILNRFVLTLASLLSLVAGVSIQTQSQIHQNKVQTLVDKLTEGRLMDQVSATELAESLSNDELNAMMDAFANPRLEAAAESVAIVHSK